MEPMTPESGRQRGRVGSAFCPRLQTVRACSADIYLWPKHGAKVTLSVNLEF